MVLAPRRINPRYHPERVLRAFARCPAAAEAFLVYKIFGDNPRTERLQQDMLTQLAAELGVQQRIRFAPPCAYSDLPGLYRLADVGCFLLSHDGTPTTAFELMAADVPIVTSEIEDYQGMLVNGQHASLVPPEDADAAAAQLQRALKAPHELREQCARARQWVESHATMDISAQKFLQAYGQAADACTLLSS